MLDITEILHILEIYYLPDTLKIIDVIDTRYIKDKLYNISFDILDILELLTIRYIPDIVLACNLSHSISDRQV